jgi:Kef-type K+ transport system membrane component KefB
MFNIFLFFAFILFSSLLLGRLVEKIRVPWIFSALFIGFLLAIYNPFSSITSSDSFNLFAQLGMYFLLFMIGFEIDLEQIKGSGRFIVKATFLIISLEALFGSFLIHYVLGYGWYISFLVSMSFATVGEAILFPILDEFKVVNTKLGQSIIGIGTLDDIIELVVLVLVIMLIGSEKTPYAHLFLVLSSLCLLFLLTFGLTKLKRKGKIFEVMPVQTIFLLVLAIFFIFIGIGQYANASAIAALLAGVGLKSFMPIEHMNLIKTEIRTMCYGFFAPIFFVSVGVAMDINYLIAYPLLVLLVVAVSKGAKLLGSYIIARKELGGKHAILLGIGLSVRFSTSIVVVKILFENELIGSDLYSIIIASSMAFKFIVPVLFANLLVRWKVKE